MSINQQVSDAGYYQLYLNPGETLEEYAFNYNRRESDLSYFSPTELGDYVGSGMNVIEVQDKAVLTATIEERSQGLVLWRWCLIFALVFLAIEVLLLRLWKTH